MVLVVVWVFLITSEFEYKPVDSPSYRTPENIIVSVISPIIFFLPACVYRPPGPYSTVFLEEVFTFSSFYPQSVILFIFLMILIFL